MPEKNQIFTAVMRIFLRGSGVCRLDGMAVFVPETAVGDRVSVRLVKVLKNYAYGIIEELLEPSPDRIVNDCPVYKSAEDAFSAIFHTMRNVPLKTISS